MNSQSRWKTLVALSAIVCFGLSPRTLAQVTIYEDDNMMRYCWFEISHWNLGEGKEPNACSLHRSSPDSGFYNTPMHVGSDITAAFGYPHHYALIAGINDTLDAYIPFMNRPGWPDYVVKGKKIEQWFAPQAYMPDVNAMDPSVLLLDSTQLGYRMRGWYTGGG